MANPIITASKNKAFKIPQHFVDSAYRSNYIKQLIKSFENVIKFLSVCKVKDFEPSIKSDIINRIKSIQEGLIEVMEEYFKGHPSKAYELFSDRLEEHEVDKELSSIQQISIPANTSFFRIQRVFADIPLSVDGKDGFLGFKKPLDLFHPPFQFRRSVGTNRFSISGYPCLYLSETLHTSYSECFRKGEFNKFNAITFKNIRPLYFIDLSENKLQATPAMFTGILPKSGSKTIVDVDGILEFMGIYQLIIATHTKVQYKERYKGEKYYFKAEYIIPQLLLQWIKLKGLSIDGIRYKSCTGSTLFPNLNNHYNYVLPVKSNLDRQYCPTLKALFKSSLPYNCLTAAKPASLNSFLEKITITLDGSSFNTLP